jgi:hypothetical protein
MPCCEICTHQSTQDLHKNLMTDCEFSENQFNERKHFILCFPLTLILLHNVCKANFFPALCSNSSCNDYRFGDEEKYFNIMM